MLRTSLKTSTFIRHLFYNRGDTFNQDQATRVENNSNSLQRDKINWKDLRPCRTFFFLSWVETQKSTQVSGKVSHKYLVYFGNRYVPHLISLLYTECLMLFFFFYNGFAPLTTCWLLHFETTRLLLSEKPKWKFHLEWQHLEKINIMWLVGTSKQEILHLFF